MGHDQYHEHREKATQRSCVQVVLINIHVPDLKVCSFHEVESDVVRLVPVYMIYLIVMIFSKLNSQVLHVKSEVISDKNPTAR